jgi:hypothetical protein
MAFSFTNITKKSCSFKLAVHFRKVCYLKHQTPLLFSTSYLCEIGFPVVAALEIKRQKELSVSISNMKPSFEKLCSARQVPGSH